MAISLLGNYTPTTQYASLQPKTTTYGSLSTPSTQYASLMPKSTNLSVASPTNSSIYTPTTSTMGVKATSPTTNVQAPSTVLPKAQQQPIASNPFAVAPGTGTTLEQLRASNNTGTGAGSQDPTALRTTTQGGQPTTPPPTPTYSGILGQLVQNSTQPSAAYYEAQQRYQDALNHYNTLQNQQAQALADNAGNPIPLQFQQGRAQVLQSQYGQQLAGAGGLVQGAANALGAANTQQQTQQAGLLGAAGYAQPQLAGYNQQAFNPLTGQFSGGGSLDQAVANVVEKLKAGTMSYNDALSALSGYGQGGVNALQQALPQGFNIAQSNTLAGQQGSVNATYTLANQALANAEDKIKNLGLLQSTNAPGANVIGKAFSDITGIGSQPVQEYIGAINTLRNRYASLLASARGGIPSDFSSQANAEIPDWPTPNQLEAIRNTFNTLGTQVKDVYGNPGTSGTTQNATGNLYSW